MAAQPLPANTKAQAYLLEVMKGATSLAEDPLCTVAEIDDFLNVGHITLKTYRKLLITRLQRGE